MKLTQQEFDAMVEQFLATQDNVTEDEWFTTHYRIAEHVMATLRTHLFSGTAFSPVEHKEYLRLKAKYEMS